MAKFGSSKKVESVMDRINEAEAREAELAEVCNKIAILEAKKDKLRADVFTPAAEANGGEWTGKYFKMTLQNGRVKEDSIKYPEELAAKLCKYKAMGAALDVERKASQAYKDAAAAAPKTLVCKVLKDK